MITPTVIVYILSLSLPVYCYYGLVIYWLFCLTVDYVCV